MIRQRLIIFLLCLLLVSCSAAQPEKPAGKEPRIPEFNHVIWIVLENKNFDEVIGNAEMPYLNDLAVNNVLLDQYYAVRHPSLPNYIALVSGDTHGISKDCRDCFLDQPNLADRIEAAGRTWKTYQEDMPTACFVGDQGQYVQKHNPFIYFDSIRLNKADCEERIVPLEGLARDLTEDKLPDFALISPNLCHSGHDCGLGEVDQWLKQVVEPLIKSPEMRENSLIVITFDEAKKIDTTGCCGLGWRAGGRVATILISPEARPGTTDSTQYSHYSLLKTVLISWNLPDLGATSDARTTAITAPWK